MNMEAWNLARPWGLAALLLPLVLMLLSFLPQRPVPRVTGTLEFWRSLAGPVRGTGASRRLPLSRWFLVGSLILGALALAGPRPRLPEAPEHWTVVVDQSPSMYLPEPSGGRLRIQAAHDRMQEWVAEHAGGARLGFTYVVEGRGGTQRVDGPDMPRTWWKKPPLPLPELDLGRWDQFGVLVLTDIQEVDPERAGLFASGAAPVPGPVADQAASRLVFDGESVVSEPALQRRIQVQDLPPVLESFVRLWGEDRGFHVETTGPGGGEPPALIVAVPSHPERPRPLSGGGAGWSLVGSGNPLASLAGRTPWLVGSGLLVDEEPGRVRVAFQELEEPGGDPAAFALDWAGLFDRSLLARADTVSLAERRHAGPARTVAPAEVSGGQVPGGGGPTGPATPEVALAAACALLGVMSRLLRSG